MVQAGEVPKTHQDALVHNCAIWFRSGDWGESRQARVQGALQTRAQDVRPGLGQEVGYGVWMGQDGGPGRQDWSLLPLNLYSLTSPSCLPPPPLVNIILLSASQTLASHTPHSEWHRHVSSCTWSFQLRLTESPLGSPSLLGIRGFQLHCGRIVFCCGQP